MFLRFDERFFLMKERFLIFRNVFHRDERTFVFDRGLLFLFEVCKQFFGGRNVFFLWRNVILFWYCIKQYVVLVVNVCNIYVLLCLIKKFIKWVFRVSFVMFWKLFLYTYLYFFLNVNKNTVYYFSLILGFCCFLKVYLL